MGIASDLEKEQQKSGYDEKKEPDGNSCEFGRDGVHEQEDGTGQKRKIQSLGRKKAHEQDRCEFEEKVKDPT